MTTETKLTGAIAQQHAETVARNKGYEARLHAAKEATAAKKTEAPAAEEKSTEKATEAPKTAETKSNVLSLPVKKDTAKKAAATEKKPAAKKPATGKKITLVAKECPSKAGTRRAKWWKLLKTGMTTSEAQEAGVTATFIKRMAAAGHIKLG